MEKIEIVIVADSPIPISVIRSILRSKGFVVIGNVGFKREANEWM